MQKFAPSYRGQLSGQTPARWRESVQQFASNLHAKWPGCGDSQAKCFPQYGFCLTVALSPAHNRDATEMHHSMREASE